MNRVKSHKPKKQRRFHYQKPLHLKQAGLSVHLDKKGRQLLGVKSVSVRKNDTVKVLSGAKKGSTGKITGIDYSKGVVFIDKLVRKKASGEEILLPVHASNLVATDLDRSDAKRFKRRKEEDKQKEGKGREKEHKQLSKEESEKKKEEKPAEKEKPARKKEGDRPKKEEGKENPAEKTGKKE